MTDPAPSPTSIQSDISRIQAEATDAYVVAGCINLYYEVLRRKRGRVIFGPGDVDRLFTIVTMFLDVAQTKNISPDARPHEPTPEERTQIIDQLQVIEAEVQAETDSQNVKTMRRRMST